MSKKSVRVEVTSQQFEKLRDEVLCNLRLSEAERRRAIRKIVPLPSDGSPVDLYCEGKFVAAV